MKNKKLSLFLFWGITLFLCFTAKAQRFDVQTEFQLVESKPAETIYEKSKLPETAEVWIEMINSATVSLDIETFYFANEKDEALEPVMTAIKDAAKRGVKVRIIVDLSFYKNDKSVDEFDGIANITIRKINFKNVGGGVMHAKYFVVDRENVFCGSQNMDWRAIKHIHEIGCRIKNANIANTFMNIYETDWTLCKDDGETQVEKLKSNVTGNIVNATNPETLNTKSYGNIEVYPAFSPLEILNPALNNEETEMLKIISGAKKKLWVQMYSYSPKASKDEGFYDKIDNVLREAAARGVKIKMILSDWAIKESATEFIQDLSTVKNISIKFSTIPQYSGGFIPYSRVEHCKFFVADNNISWISTSNWEWGYFHSSRNATFIVKNKKVNLELSKVFARDWKGPYAKTVDPLEKYKPVKKK